MKIMKSFFTLYRTLLYLAIIAYIGVAVLPMIVGVRPFIVLSGSMEPEIQTASLAYVKLKESKSPLADLVEYKEVGQGDIIAFEQGAEGKSIIVVHRINQVLEDGSFETKGDNNEATDLGAVSQDQMLGRFLFSIPKLGKITSDLKTKKGLIIALVLVLIAFISSFITDSQEIDETNKAAEDNPNERPAEIINENNKN